MSSSSVSFLLLANPEKDDPNSGIVIFLFLSLSFELKFVTFLSYFTIVMIVFENHDNVE